MLDKTQDTLNLISCGRLAHKSDSKTVEAEYYEAYKKALEKDLNRIKTRLKRLNFRKESLNSDIEQTSQLIEVMELRLDNVEKYLKSGDTC